MAYQHNETRALYTGPIPSASELEKYNQVLPGLAERIMKMAEIQSAHRQELEKKVIDSNIKGSKKGQIFGFIIGMSGLGIVTYCASLGLQFLAGIIAAIDIVGLVKE